MPQAIAVPLAVGVTGAAVGASVAQLQDQKKMQKRAIRAQEEAQRLATSRAAAESRRQEMENRRLRRRTPNIQSLLRAEERGSLTGAGSTILTGAGGVDSSKITLGRASLLGAA